MNKNVLSYTPTPNREIEMPHSLLSIAEVTEIHNSIPVSVTLNEQHYIVVGYLSLMPGIVPNVSLGDKVLISSVAEGVLIHGVVMPVDAPIRASFGIKDDKLVIEAEGAVVLKSGNASVELTAEGSIRIDGKDVRTVAKKSLTLLGGNVNLN